MTGETGEGDKGAEHVDHDVTRVPHPALDERLVPLIAGGVGERDEGRDEQCAARTPSICVDAPRNDHGQDPEHDDVRRLAEHEIKGIVAGDAQIGPRAGRKDEGRPRSHGEEPKDATKRRARVVRRRGHGD